jgi:CHAD domain-containing protein
MYTVVQLPEAPPSSRIREIFGSGFHLGRVGTIKLTYLDTFDWRIAGAGARLWLETTRGRRVLHWSENADGTAYTLPVPHEIRFASDLPKGFLRDRVGPICDIRALTPMGALRVNRRSGALRDEDGNSRGHIHLEEVAILDRAGAPADHAFVIRVLGVMGFDRQYNKIVKRLRKLGTTDRQMEEVFHRAVGVYGRGVGDYSSKLRLNLEPDQPSEVALRSILKRLFANIRANVAGVVDDIDIEFLHDLRVATRRTRSALTQLKGVLPRDQVDRFLPDFKWLGTLTGPCRDLDVYLLEMETYRRLLPEHVEELKPLERAIERSRQIAHREVCAGLGSQRFADLIDRWGRFLDGPTPDEARPKHALQPVGPVASARIIKAYRRMVRKGSGLGDGPPAEALHRLRIDAKKLRYLLEFFRSLYPGKRMVPLIGELKDLQDILGGFNDMDVQQAGLVRFADTLSDTDGRETRATLIAMGRLAAALEHRQKEFQRAFAGRFEVFAGPASQQHYESLFDPGGPR